ncbi:hypothetical protein BDF19DRAFT_437355 [Syncephalis fuscata]|nr:hypothetical protein BDF19DRAFT_437355 [Syncephalis fuscata]
MHKGLNGEHGPNEASRDHESHRPGQEHRFRRDMNNEDFKKSSFDQEHRGGFPGQHKEHQGNDHRGPEMHKELNGEHGPNEASRDHESHRPGQEHRFRRDMNNEDFKKLLFDQEHRGGFFDKHMEYKKPNGEHGQNGASRDHESRKQDTHKSQDGHGL